MAGALPGWPPPVPRATLVELAAGEIKTMRLNFPSRWMSREVPVAGWVLRIIAARPRLFIGFACGVAAYGLIPPIFGLQPRAIVAWGLGVSVFLVLTAILFLGEHQDRMASDAERQEEGEWTIFFLTVAGVSVSIIAIIHEFSASKGVPPAQRNLHLAIVAFTLLASWLMLHATFALRYAHEFYEKPSGAADYQRGLQFPGEDNPDYLDFMYFSLVLGMTFQVSDVQITSRKLRRVAALQGLLSFLFNTIIVALTVNLAAGLL
jgi:uncharacterized membrane protein